MLVRQPMAAFIEKQMTCLDLTGGDTRTRDVQFQDLAKPGELPGLDNALYQIEVDGYCYHTECNLDLRAPLTAIGMLESRVKCRGGDIGWVGTEWQVMGLSVPAAVKTIRVRVLRNGLSVYDDTVGTHPCPERGLCVIESMRR